MLKNVNLDELGKELGCTLKISKTGSPAWKRIFVIDKDGCSIARISLENDEFYSFKHYKPYYIKTLSDEDKICLRLEKYLTTGTIVPSDIYDQLVAKAIKIADKDIAEKKAWRATNPPKKNKRKGLTRRSERFIVANLVRAWQKCPENNEELQCSG